MSGLKRLIHEIHRRSLWQVLLIYVAASWVTVSKTLTAAGGSYAGHDSEDRLLLHHRTGQARRVPAYDRIRKLLNVGARVLMDGAMGSELVRRGVRWH